jgi:hypothetical protein
LQGERVKEIGEANAKREAELFGTSLGSLKKGALPSEAAKTKLEGGEDQRRNPWSQKFAGDRTAAIQNFIKTFGSAASARMAKAAGADLAGRPLAR